MARSLILVRHPPVAAAWNGRCYGRSDMGLSRAGRAMIAPLVDQLAAMRPDHVLHSGLRRARMVAEPLGRRLGLDPVPAPLWQERDFGDWEGRGWSSIYRATGNAMDGMIDDPDRFRPGISGETTGELIARVGRALQALPTDGPVVVVSHGGSIAAARHFLKKGSIDALAAQIVPLGSIVELAI